MYVLGKSLKTEVDINLCTHLTFFTVVCYITYQSDYLKKEWQAIPQPTGIGYQRKFVAKIK